jgi:hypothetical protein
MMFDNPIAAFDQGLRQGEAERIALATANSNLRSILREVSLCGISHTTKGYVELQVPLSLLAEVEMYGRP